MTHRELCFDLAEAKGTNFIEIPLGSVWLSRTGDNLGIADVITIKPSYNRFNLDIYECKVTRTDFLKDIRSEKYKKYLPFCNRLYFACTSGLVNKAEIPDNVGLIVRGERGWTTIKQAKKIEQTISQEMLLSLLFFKGRVYNKKRTDISSIYNLNTINKRQLKGFGKEIRNMILNYNNLELKFRNLLYNVTDDGFELKTEEERKKFKEYWENLKYIYD